MDTLAKQLLVHGVVQGVNYRYSCRRQAARLGVSGWVQNRYDGTVQIHAQGPADGVRDLIEWAHHGPRMARVTAVDVADASWEDTDSFEVR